jgi:hypothetical protein
MRMITELDRAHKQYDQGILESRTVNVTEAFVFGYRTSRHEGNTKNLPNGWNAVVQQNKDHTSSTPATMNPE